METYYFFITKDTSFQYPRLWEHWELKSAISEESSEIKTENDLRHKV